MLVKYMQFHFHFLPGIPSVTREIHGVKKILLGAGDGGYLRANVVPFQGLLFAQPANTSPLIAIVWYTLNEIVAGEWWLGGGGLNLTAELFSKENNLSLKICNISWQTNFDLFIFLFKSLFNGNQSYCSTCGRQSCCQFISCRSLFHALSDNIRVHLTTSLHNMQYHLIPCTFNSSLIRPGSIL